MQILYRLLVVVLLTIVSLFVVMPSVALADGPDLEPLNAVGGWVEAVAVRDNYAYLGQGAKLIVLDVSDPMNPQVVGQTSTPPDHARLILDVNIKGDYAYLRSYSALQVIDISNPIQPVLGMTVPAPDSRIFSYDITMAVVGNYGYITTIDDDYNSPTGPRLHVLDLSTPYSPTIVSSQEVGNRWDDIDRLCTTDDYLHISTSSDLYIFDLADPANPMPVGSHDGTCTGGIVDGNVQYMQGDYSISIWDITNPDTPTQLGSYSTDWIGDFSVSNDLAVIALLEQGAELVDVSDPTSPTLLSRYHSGDVGIIGAVQGNIAYNRYFDVIDFSDPLTPTIISHNSDFDIDARSSDVVSGTYAYAIHNNYATGSPGLYVVDISQPLSPTLVGYNSADVNFELAVWGQHVYVGVSGNNLGIFNVADPTNPTVVATYTLSSQISGIEIVDGYAYVAGDGLRVLDVTNPNVPVQVGLLSTADYVGEVLVDGDRAYISKGDSLHVVDISNPMSLTILTSYNYSLGYVSFAMSQDVLYVSNYSSSLPGCFARFLALDTSDTANLQLMDDYCIDAEGVHIHVSDGYVYADASGSGNGLHVFPDLGQPLYLIHPLDGTMLATKHPIFRWGVWEDDISYYVLRIESNTTQAQATTLITTTQTSYTPTVDWADGVYTWTVQAYDITGQSSIAAGPAQFSIRTEVGLYLPLVVKEN